MLLGRQAPVTTALLIVIAIGFGIQLRFGDAVTALGANYGPAVREGEYWRLVTSMFLHGGWLHLVLNAWALYQLAGLFEILLGSSRLLLVYFLSGIAGSVASVLWTNQPSVGASGAIFGVLGALIAFLARRRERLTPQARSLLMQLLFWAGLNVVLGISDKMIDNAAHLGGCAVGLAIGFFLQERPRYEPLAPAPGSPGF
ncbi:MAG TPA: rhomboid family intramembrane serine protease [Thermoanaerobaculia bacterium]|nr:rhomboid family intramembrane serine protease [Thermoanaerobaculia bacterium]